MAAHVVTQSTLFDGDEMIRTVRSPLNHGQRMRARKGRRLTPFERAVADEVIARGLMTCECMHPAQAHATTGDGPESWAWECTECKCERMHLLIDHDPPERTAAAEAWRSRWRARVGALVERADEPVLRFDRADEVARRAARLWPLVREAARIDGPVAEAEVRRILKRPGLVPIAHTSAAGRDSWIVRWLSPPGAILVHPGADRLYPMSDRVIDLCSEIANGDRAALAILCDLAQEAGLDVPPAERWRMRAAPAG